MDVQGIIDQLEAQKTQVENAIAALTNGAGAPKAKRGYTYKSGNGTRTMSAKARGAIAKAQKARWAKYHKEQKQKAKQEKTA